jgi:hypothetical protein
MHSANRGRVLQDRWNTLARRFVEIVKNNYPDEYTRVEKKDSYPDCMAQLTTLQSRSTLTKPQSIGLISESLN